jgi:hypothetical protein
MRALYKAPNLRFIAFRGLLTTGLLTWGIVLPAILLWSRCAIAQVTSDGTTDGAKSGSIGAAHRRHRGAKHRTSVN